MEFKDSDKIPNFEEIGKQNEEKYNSELQRRSQAAIDSFNDVREDRIRAYNIIKNVVKELEKIAEDYHLVCEISADECFINVDIDYDNINDPY